LRAGGCYLGNNMKNNSIPVLSFLAVLTATILLPVGAAASCIALTFTGVLAILVSDYGRELPALQTSANVIHVDFSSRKAATVGKAA
jgi:hypothetical protein